MARAVERVPRQVYHTSVWLVRVQPRREAPVGPGGGVKHPSISSDVGWVGIALEQEDQVEGHALAREALAGGEPKRRQQAHFLWQALPQVACAIDNQSATAGIALAEIPQALLGRVPVAAVVAGEGKRMAECGKE